jgi:hypothetical protein
MTGIELLDTYSKAAVVVKQWFLEQMLEGLKDENLPEDFKKYVREQDITNDKIGKLIDASPRALYDVFDDHKIIIDITYFQGPKFWFSINCNVDDAKFDTRKDCEKAAIEQAFKLLNEKL